MLKFGRVSARAAAVGGMVAVAGMALPAAAQVVSGQIDDFEDGTVQDWTAGGLTNPNPPTNIATGGPAGAGDNFLRLTSNGNAGAGGRLVVSNFTQWTGDYLTEGVGSLQMQVNNLGATNLTLRLIFSNLFSGQSLCTVAPVSVPAGSGWSIVSFPLTSGNLDGGGSGDFSTVMSDVTQLDLVHSPNLVFFRSGSPNIAAQLGVDNITAVGTPTTVYYWDTNGATAGAGGTAPTGNWDGIANNFNTDATGGGGGTISASPGASDTVAFAAGTGATGSYTVMVSGTRAAGKLDFTEGSATVTGGTLDVDTFDVSTGITGTVTSAVAASSTSMTKSGLGTLRVTRLPQGHFVDVSEGMVQVLESSPGLSSGHPSGNNASVSRPSSLTVAAGAVLDLTNNDLVIDYSGDTPIASYEALVASAYNVTGDWQGSGITSSIAANDGNYVVAIADNATLAAPFGTAQGGPLFAGVDVDLDTILIKFTHRADINLDGVITPDDSAVFGGNYDEGQPAVWATGDMNYDGVFTPDDAAIFGGAYDESLASLPEPMTAGVVVLLVPALSRRRRHRKAALCSQKN